MNRLFLLILSLFIITVSHADDELPTTWEDLVNYQLNLSKKSGVILEKNFQAKGASCKVQITYESKTSTFVTKIRFTNPKTYDRIVTSDFLKRSKEIFINAFLTNIINKDPSGYTGINGIQTFVNHNAKIKYIYCTIKNGKQEQKSFTISYEDLAMILINYLQ